MNRAAESVSHQCPHCELRLTGRYSQLSGRKQASAPRSAYCHVFLHFCVFAVLALQCSAEMSYTVPNWNKAMLHLTCKTYMLDQFHSGMSYNAVSHEFNVNVSTILNKVFLKTYIDEDKVLTGWWKHYHHRLVETKLCICLRSDDSFYTKSVFVPSS